MGEHQYVVSHDAELGEWTIEGVSPPEHYSTFYDAMAAVGDLICDDAPYDGNFPPGLRLVIQAEGACLTA